MDVLKVILTVVLVLISIGMTVIILMQEGKGNGLSGRHCRRKRRQLCQPQQGSYSRRQDGTLHHDSCNCFHGNFSDSEYSVIRRSSSYRNRTAVFCMDLFI